MEGNIINGPFIDMPLIPSCAHLANLLCLVFAFPFSLQLYLSLLSQQWKFFGLRNLLDMITMALQICIFFCHLLSIGIDRTWYSVLLTTQCVLLFTTVQNYGRYELIGHPCPQEMLAGF